MKTMLMCMVALAASAQGETLMPTIYYTALHGADYASTEAGLAAGARELHQLQQERGGRLAMKAAGAVIFTGADLFFQGQEKKGHKGAKAAKWLLRIGAGVGYGVLVANNMKAARDSRR